MNVICVLIGYAIGLGYAWIMFHPSKEWQDGYDTAKNTFSDWEKGFYTGYEAAADHYQDYKQGFYDGWNRCLERGQENAKTEEKE